MTHDLYVLWNLLPVGLKTNMDLAYASLMQTNFYNNISTKSFTRRRNIGKGKTVTVKKTVAFGTISDLMHSVAQSFVTWRYAMTRGSQVPEFEIYYQGPMAAFCRVAREFITRIHEDMPDDFSGTIQPFAEAKTLTIHQFEPNI